MIDTERLFDSLNQASEFTLSEEQRIVTCARTWRHGSGNNWRRD
jgi:hypothetical protein